MSNIPDGSQHTLINEEKVLKEIVGDSILDCGCGIGRWGYLIMQKFDNTLIVGIDINKEYISYTKRKGYYDHLIIATIGYLPFRPKCFDTVLAIEVIEHESKEFGFEFLNRIDEIANKKIVLTTSSGFYTLISPITSEVHKSGWSPDELKKRGYEIEEFEPLWAGLKWIFSTKILGAIHNE